MISAFDADALIYAADPSHRLGRRVRALLTSAQGEATPYRAIGSVLLIPELLAKPRRLGADGEVRELAAILGVLDLAPVERSTAAFATELAVAHRLKAPDAIHLATAIEAGADRFVTNNSRDFSEAIEEIDIVYPSDLADPAGPPT